MLKKYSYKSIISFTLIIGTILTPLIFLPKETEAQYNIAGYTRGLAPAIARLPQCGGTALGAMKGLFNGIGEMFSGGTGGSPEEDLMAKMNADPDFDIKVQDSLDNPGSQETLEEISSSLSNQITVPQMSDAEATKILKDSLKEQKKLNQTTQEMNDRSNCLASIGRLIVKMLLQKLTLSTVNWINSGYDGKPSFLTNPGKFWKDIADTEILQFGIEIRDNPYAKDWIKNQALAYRTKFAENARYSFNDIMQQKNPDYSAETFYTDFSLGGWDAWTTMTQIPANNPLGAKLMFDNELQKRLAGTSQSTAEQVHEALSQANGFLGDSRCISAGTGRIDYDITEAEYKESLDKGSPICDSWEYVTPGKMVADAATTVMGYQNNSLLNVEDLNDAVAAVSDAILNQFSTKIYEKGFANLDYQGIDGVLVFNKSNSDFRTQTEKDYIPSQLSSSWLQANPEFNIRTDLTQALIDEQRTYSDKLALQNKELKSTDDGKDYNIKDRVCPNGFSGTYPDCTASIATCPINYSGKYPDCEGPPKKLFCPSGYIKSGTKCFNGIATIDAIPEEISCPGDFSPNPSYPKCKGPTIETGACPSGWDPNPTYPNCKGPGSNNPKVSNAYGLMPAIYQLDYCIPGPHPGWEDDSRETLASKLNSFTPAEEKPPNIAGEIANGAIGVGLNFVPYVGPLLSGVFGMLTGDTEIINRDTNARASNTNEFAKLTGYLPQALRKIADEPKDTNMLTKEGLFYVLNTVLDRYINIMDKTYFSNPDMLPTITKEAAKEFNQLPGYNQMIIDNNNKISEIKATVKILGEIKDEVDKLNTELETNQITEEQYEEALKFQINAFGRLSASMVNGDDIAAANDLAQQIVLKKNYIYKNLLKGPHGCEAFLENQANIKQFPSAGSGVKQLDYDWNKYNVNSIKRMTYPFPIIYDYNNFAKGEPLPDPWDSGYTNTELPKMPAKDNYDNYNKYGPGFLNFVHFSAIYDCYKPSNRPSGETCDSHPRTNTYNGKERLSLSGLVNDFAPGYQDETRVFHNVSVGEVGPEGGGPFEKTIGVY